MFVVYLKDGRQVDIPQATSVIHRTMVVFLDGDEQVIRQLPADEVLAYSRTPYEDETEEPPPRAETRPPLQLDSELLMRPRHHRRLRNATGERANLEHAARGAGSNNSEKSQ